MVVDSNKVSLRFFLLQFEHALLPEAVLKYPDQSGASELASHTWESQKEVRVTGNLTLIGLI